MLGFAVPAFSDAWKSRPYTNPSKWHFIFGGRTWRYEFEPEGDTTLVRES